MAGETSGPAGRYIRTYQLLDGSMEDVAPEGCLRLRYNRTTNELEVSISTGAYVGWSDASLWAHGANFVYPDHVTDAVVIGAQAKAGAELLRVVGLSRLEGDAVITGDLSIAGAIDPSLLIDDALTDAAFLGLGAGDAAAVSPAGGLRLRSNTVLSRLEISINGGAYQPLFGSSFVTTTRITSVSSPYTVLASDDQIFCDTDGGAITVNLPAGTNGKTYRVINCGSSGNAVTIAPNGVQLLFGSNASQDLDDGEELDLCYETTEGWW